MITLKADNRVLVNNAKFAYLVNNVQAGGNSLVMTNLEPFAVNDPVIVSEFGQMDAEIFKIGAIDSPSSTITLVNTDGTPLSLKYPHSESTRVIVLSYDQIRFFFTDATGTIADENPTFSTSQPLTDWVPLDPSSYYTTFSDPLNTGGFGWFQYQDATTLEQSQPSNPIPYAGFGGNTAQQVFADFDSLLNVNELKLVSVSEKFSWLNEALAVLKNKLNLTNVEYTVTTPQTLATTSGVSEYLLPDDFSDLVELTDGSGREIGFISASKVLGYQHNPTNGTLYYLRGRYLGFTPSPTGPSTFYYTYRAKATRVTNYSTYIDLPDNAFYCLKDWMLYRAGLKFTNANAQIYLQSFTNSVNLFIEAASKRNADLDTWDIAPSANT